ncbi:MAG: UPF0280 family protein [Paracoccaceae bacterium]
MSGVGKTRPTARLLPDGERLHLQHGPIDLIIGADGDRNAAFSAATYRFQTILTELVSELPLLRQEVGPQATGPVARRMVDAARQHKPTFVTPMAAVAGAVAEEILAAMLAATPLNRAYVNNGGDIAFHLTDATRFRMAIAGLNGQPLGRVDVAASDAARGLATSGQGGRSLSFGIADAVTVLAKTAAAADVAATLIANAVDLPGHPAIARAPANTLQPDTDLADRLVVTRVGPLVAADTAEALDRGTHIAQTMLQGGLILSAALFLNRQVLTVGQNAETFLADPRIPAHA